MLLGLEPLNWEIVVVDFRFFSLFPVFTVFTVICPRVSGGGLFSLLCGDMLKSRLVSYCIASLVSVVRLLGHLL